MKRFVLPALASAKVSKDVHAIELNTDGSLKRGVDVYLIDIDVNEPKGRGIPLGKLDDCVSNVNTGAKYNTNVFKQAIGMNGVGIKATNALSSYFRAASIRDGKMAVVE